MAEKLKIIDVIDVVADERVPPGVAFLVSGKEIVPIVNIGPNEAMTEAEVDALVKESGIDVAQSLAVALGRVRVAKAKQIAAEKAK